MNHGFSPVFIWGHGADLADRDVFHICDRLLEMGLETGLQNSPKIKTGLELCAHNPILISSQFDSMTPNFTNGAPRPEPQF
jgi:hypothetical protein